MLLKIRRDNIYKTFDSLLETSKYLLVVDSIILKMTSSSASSLSKTSFFYKSSTYDYSGTMRRRRKSSHFVQLFRIIPTGSNGRQESCCKASQQRQRSRQTPCLACLNQIGFSHWGLLKVNVSLKYLNQICSFLKVILNGANSREYSRFSSPKYYINSVSFFMILKSVNLVNTS